MSFVKTLATLAVGFAAARGAQKVQQMGGLDGVKKAMRGAGEPGGVADQMGAMAEKMGLPGGKEQVRQLFDSFGDKAASATEATEAGLGSFMAAMTGAATAGAKTMGEMMGAITGATPAAPMAEANARLMIRAMIQAAKADGEIDADERKALMDHLSDASEEELAFVKAQLDAPVDAMGLARDAGETVKGQVYSSALMAIQVDSDAERAYLRGLASALGLDAATVAALHASMGKPAV